MTARGVSTVVDVSVCLLLVGVAVLALATAPTPAPEPSADRAGQAVETLATSTATVNATIGGRRRTTRGTLAGLLAEVAVANATGGDGDLRRGVAAAVRPVLDGRGWQGQAVATWRPYRGAPFGGSVRVGHRPPPDADVHAAAATVAVGPSRTRRSAADAARRDGYRGVASTVAAAAVRGLFPPADTRIALGGPARSDTLARYRALGDRYGVPAGRIARADGPRRANERLRAAMTDRFAADLRGRFGTPTAAASAVRVGRVRITVRTWSA